MNQLDFETKLLNWYAENRRILPWREEPSPYHVWLSEIMLQQTRVEAVKEYYKRFLSMLPDIPSLANAEEDVYMKLWEGLGYYSRVRNLHKGAQEVMEQYGGELPSSSEALKKISGIGPYTSSAIASIAFGERIPAIDGNLLRVFARLTSYAENIKEKAAADQARKFYLERMSDKDPGSFNQALMDIGAVICTPSGQPLCGQCPFASVCSAHAEGRELEFPVMPEKKVRAVDELTVFVIHDGQQIILSKRPAKGLLAGLYEYPNTKGHLTEAEAIAYLESIGYPALHIRRLPDTEHIFTHRTWKMRGFEIRADEFLDELRAQDETGKDGRKYLLADIAEIQEKYSIPTAFRKVWEP